MHLDQLGIALFGVAAIYLSQDVRPSVSRWASVFGLCGQPFWIYATWTAGQAGMLVICFCYTGAWAKGFYTHWIRVKK